MAGTVLRGSTDQIFLFEDSKGRTYVKGLNETRLKFLEMGGDRNLFEKWMKEAAKLVAREASITAPVRSGKLSASIRGWASKSVEIKNKTTGIVAKRMVFGGVITAGSSRVRGVDPKSGKPIITGVQYARAVSLGTYHVAGAKSIAGDRTWRKSVRGARNPYMVKARQKMKPRMVVLLNYRLNTYIKQKGFQTHGL